MFPALATRKTGSLIASETFLVLCVVDGPLSQPVLIAHPADVPLDGLSGGENPVHVWPGARST